MIAVKRKKSRNFPRSLAVEKNEEKAIKLIVSQARSAGTLGPQSPWLPADRDPLVHWNDERHRSLCFAAASPNEARDEEAA